MNQRINKLSFTRVAGDLSVTTPSDAQITPPGDYQLFILNVSGVPSIGATIRIGTGVPLTVAAPTNLAASATGTNQINLTWQDNSSNESGFRVSRSLDATNFTVVATLGANVTAYVDTGLAASTQYYYRVVAFNSTVTPPVDSPSSNVAGATTRATGSPKPNAPTNLSATAVSASQINLSWQDNSTNETSLWVARSTDGVNFSGRKTLAANSTSFSDTGLAPSTKYFYYVLASNANVTPAVDSPSSNIASATTTP